MFSRAINNTIRFFLTNIRSYERKRLVDRGLTLGKNVNIEPGVVLDASHCWHIEIHDNVTLAPGVHLLAHDASSRHLTGLTRIGRIVIEEGVFVGARSIILPGVTIGRQSIIGAGSVVTKDIPPNVVASGNPANVVCSVDEFSEKHKKAQESVRCFSEEYTIENGITKAMKEEMNKSLALEKFNYLP